MSDVDIPPSTSIKVRIVSFVRAFMLAHEISPSLNEIALHVGSTKPRVSRALDELVAAGRLLRKKRCPRGLSFPGDLDRAVAILRSEGWNIDGDLRRAAPPRVTK